MEHLHSPSLHRSIGTKIGASPGEVSRPRRATLASYPRQPAGTGFPASDLPARVKEDSKPGASPGRERRGRVKYAE